jgi:CBS-domain-containing membrane protein
MRSGYSAQSGPKMADPRQAARRLAAAAVSAVSGLSSAVTPGVRLALAALGVGVVPVIAYGMTREKAKSDEVMQLAQFRYWRRVARALSNNVPPAPFGLEQSSIDAALRANTEYVDTGSNALHRLVRRSRPEDFAPLFRRTLRGRPGLFDKPPRELP